MPTLNKLEYLDETKQDIKNALNTNFNSGITDSTTFRNYVGKIQDIYTNWPKVTNEGTELSFTAKKGKMVLEPKGNTEQDSYSGKNLFNYNIIDVSTVTIDNDGTILISGTEASNGYTLTNKTLSQLCPSLQVGDTVYIYIESDFTERQYMYSSDGSFWRNGGSKTITQEMLNANIILYGGYQTTSHLKIMITKTLDTSFEPFVGGIPSPSSDYPQDIKVVKGDNTIKVTGKNLLNVSNSYSVTTSQEVNINLETGTYSMSCTDITTDVTTGTSSLCNFYHSDNTFDQLYFSHTNKVGQITITAPVTKVKIYSSNSFNNSNGKTTTFTNLMIEKGSTATTYQPYQETLYPLNLGTTEVCKIGTYQDSFERDNKGIWGTNIKIGKVVLDGSEDWQIILNVDNSNLFRIDFTGYEKNQIIYCNYYKGLANQNNRQNFNIYLRNDSNPKLDILDNRFTTVEDFKTWLSNNPVTVYYVLNTPTGEEIGLPSASTLASQLEALYNAMAVDGTNIITSTYADGNAPVIINYSALEKGGN